MRMARGVFVVLLATCMMAAAGDKGLLTMTGWVNDSKCQAEGKKPDPGSVRSCVASGATLVFVDDGEKKVYQVATPKELMNYAGEHVQVKATLTKEGALKIKDVMGVSDSPASQALASPK